MLGIDANVERFDRGLNACRERVRSAYVTYLLDAAEGKGN